MNQAGASFSLINSAKWQRSVTSWLHQALDANGLHQTGDLVEVQRRPWSVILQVPTESEDLYFKASGLNLTHEAKITAWLFKTAPDLVVEVVAHEPDRGWLLLRSAGERMRRAVNPESLVEVWQGLLPAYAELQLTSAGHAEELLAMGLPDRRLATLPAHLDRWQAVLGSAALKEDLFTKAELNRLARIAGSVADACVELAELGPAPAINHGDLHDGNVGLSGRRLRIFDWGDVSLSHPFFSLRTTFVNLEIRLGLAPEDEVFECLAQSYLSIWRTHMGAEALKRAMGLARRLWSLGSALGWEAALGSYEGSFQGEYGAVLPSLMRELLLAFGQKIDGDL